MGGRLHLRPKKSRERRLSFGCPWISSNRKYDHEETYSPCRRHQPSAELGSHSVLTYSKGSKKVRGTSMKKRVLFVDDEVNLREGLRRMSYLLRDEWDMAFAESGVQALVLLSKVP